MVDFIIHSDYGKSIKAMTNEEVGELIKALIAHTEQEEVELSSPTVRAVFPIMSDRIDRDIEYRRKASEYGKKGGAPFGNTNAKTRVNKGDTRVVQGSDKAKQTPNPNPKPNPKDNKRQYGVCENVLLTEEEHQKIVSAGYTELIDELSLYIDSKGAKYKSHYSTILSWARRREKEAKVVSMSGQNAKNQFNRYKQRDDYDIEAIERKLIRN